jgi:aromatic-L-amino-acid/L-tryptophan decarboxylase
MDLDPGPDAPPGARAHPGREAPDPEPGAGGASGALLAAARLAVRHLEAVPGRPVWRPTDPAVLGRIAGAALPEHGAAPDRWLEAAARDVLAYPMGNGHPAFFGWVNSAPDPAALAGAWLAAAANPSSAGGDHADVHLERTVVRWLADLAGFPHRPGGGLLTSGASMATLVACGAARHRALERAGRDVREEGMAGAPVLTAYATGEAHSCVRKALEVLGIGSRHLRTVPLAGGRLDAAAARALIAADRAAGAVPFLVVGSAGTVNTGALDPLDAIADLAAEHGLWFHADGAYGGFGVLDPLLAARYAGMERADSLALDPHKWLQVPVGTGALLVADPAGLRAAFSLVPPYLRDESGDALGWFSEYGIEQSRPFRALAVWATITARGRAGIAADIAACTGAARRLAGLVRAHPDLELVGEPEVSIVAYRYAPAGLGGGAAERVNLALPGAVQAAGRAFVTGSSFQGRAILRACLINPAVREEHLRLLLDETCAAGRALLAADTDTDTDTGDDGHDDGGAAGVGGAGAGR